MGLKTFCYKHKSVIAIICTVICLMVTIGLTLNAASVNGDIRFLDTLAGKGAVQVDYDDLVWSEFWEGHGVVDDLDTGLYKVDPDTVRLKMPDFDDELDFKESKGHWIRSRNINAKGGIIAWNDDQQTILDSYQKDAYYEDYKKLYNARHPTEEAKAANPMKTRDEMTYKDLTEARFDGLNRFYSERYIRPDLLDGRKDHAEYIKYLFQAAQRYQGLLMTHPMISGNIATLAGLISSIFFWSEARKEEEDQELKAKQIDMEYDIICKDQYSGDPKYKINVLKNKAFANVPENPNGPLGSLCVRNKTICQIIAALTLIIIGFYFYVGGDADGMGYNNNLLMGTFIVAGFAKMFLGITGYLTAYRNYNVAHKKAKETYKGYVKKHLDSEPSEDRELLDGVRTLTERAEDIKHWTNKGQYWPDDHKNAWMNNYLRRNNYEAPQDEAPQDVPPLNRRPIHGLITTVNEENGQPMSPNTADRIRQQARIRQDQARIQQAAREEEAPIQQEDLRKAAAAAKGKPMKQPDSVPSRLESSEEAGRAATEI